MSNYVETQAAKARESLVPAKSQAAYSKEYECFQEWKRKKLVDGVSDSILLAYFQDLLQPSTNMYRLKEQKKGINDALDQDGNTALHLAVINNNEPTDLLLKKAKPNKKNYKGNTPVHLSVLHGRMEMLRSLVKHGGNIDLPGDKGLLPVEMVALSTDQNCMAAVLALKPNLKKRDSFGNTPLLHYLKEHPDRLNDIRRLLDHGSNPNTTDVDGRNGLLIVIANRSAQQRVELTRALLDYGMSVNSMILNRIVMSLTPDQIGEDCEDLIGIIYQNKDRMVKRSPYDPLTTTSLVSLYANHILKGTDFVTLELILNLMGLDDINSVQDECELEINYLQHLKITDYPLTFYQYLFISPMKNCELVNQKPFRDEIVRCVDYFTIYSDIVLDKLNEGLLIRRAKRDCAVFLQNLTNIPNEVCVMIINYLGHKETKTLFYRLKLEKQ